VGKAVNIAQTNEFVVGFKANVAKIELTNILRRQTTVRAQKKVRLSVDSLTLSNTKGDY